MRHRSLSGEAVELRPTASTRIASSSPCPSEIEGLLSRVAGGLTTTTDARKLRVLLSRTTYRIRG